MSAVCSPGKRLATNPVIVGNNNHNRVWVEILALGTAVACAVALLVVTLATPIGIVGGESAFAQTEPAPSGQQIVEGMLTCSRCQARHSASLGKNAADCVRACAHMGAGFMLLDGEKVYQLEGDPNVFKQLAARRVQVVGAIQGDTIRVSSMKTAE